VAQFFSRRFTDPRDQEAVIQVRPAAEPLRPKPYAGPVAVTLHCRLTGSVLLALQASTLGWLVTLACRCVISSGFVIVMPCPALGRELPNRCSSCVCRSVKELRAATTGRAPWNMVLVSLIFSLLWGRKAIPGR